MTTYYKLNSGEIVYAGKDPDKCYYARPNKQPVIWASFKTVLSNRATNGTARKLTSKEVKELVGRNGTQD